MHQRLRLPLLCGIVVLCASACASSTPPAPDAGRDAQSIDAPADARPTAADASDPRRDAEIDSRDLQTDASGRLQGVVRDTYAVPVQGVHVAVAEQWVYSATDGSFELSDLAAGPATVKLTREWFADKDLPTIITPDGTTILELQLEAKPLKIEPADQSLAESYNASFDWTKDALSIVVLPSPSRKNLDNAFYHHNPALYRDTTQEPSITPSPLPTIDAAGGHAFDFALTGGPHAGKQALVAASIVDAIESTPLSADERDDYLIWRPMINWLDDWDPSKTSNIDAAGMAVYQQSWNSNSFRPQEIENVYLHHASKEIWVKVVFENFVELGGGISDTDQDGRKEIFAQLDSIHCSAEIFDKLVNEYVTPKFDTHALSKELARSLNELYASTFAEIDQYIGEPVVVTGLGTIKYPFVVVKHSQGEKNVLLVGSP